MAERLPRYFCPITSQGAPPSRANSSIREIICGLWRNNYSRYQVSVLRAFIDDSGSGGDSTWYVLAGYVATVDGWDRFDPLWRSVLDEDPPIEHFKSTEAIWRRGQFRGFTTEQRDTKIDSLIGVIEQCTDRAICARVRQRDYDEIIKNNIPPKWDSAYYFLFAYLIGSTIAIEKLYGPGEPMEFVFDSDERHERPAYDLVFSLLPFQSFSGLVNVMYRDDKIFLPLQAADLLAWQIRRAFSCSKEPRRKAFDNARLCPVNPPHTHVLTRGQLDEVLVGMRNEAVKRGRSPDLTRW